MIELDMLKRYAAIILCALSITGCASIQSAESSKLTETFNHPYEKVYYACEDAISFVHNWNTGYYIKESRIDDGYIYAHTNGGPFGVVILVEKIDDTTTRVKVSSESEYIFYNEFIKNLKRILERPTPAG